MTGKLIGASIGIALTLMALFFAERHGYNRCSNEDKLAVVEQKLTDVKAVAEIKGFTEAKAKENERVKIIIKKIPDPSGCAKSVVPVARVNKLRESFNSQ